MRVGIITGSGSYVLRHLADGVPGRVVTRFGTAELTRGTFAGVDVVYVSRHLPGHRLLSSQVRHRANIVALAEAGVDAIVAVTLCGSLDPALPPGALIVFDDLYFPSNRLPDGTLCTLHDDPGASGRGHWIFDMPFSQPLREALLAGARGAGHPARDGGCYGHTDGPRFNTRAELRTLAQAGVNAVSQTAGPETVLAGEAGVPYALLGFITDFANGIRPDDPTPVAELARLLDASGDIVAEVLAATLPVIPPAGLGPVGTRLSWD